MTGLSPADAARALTLFGNYPDALAEGAIIPPGPIPLEGGGEFAELVAPLDEIDDVRRRWLTIKPLSRKVDWSAPERLWSRRLRQLCDELRAALKERMIP